MQGLFDAYDDDETETETLPDDTDPADAVQLYGLAQ